MTPRCFLRVSGESVHSRRKDLSIKLKFWSEHSFTKFILTAWRGRKGPSSFLQRPGRRINHYNWGNDDSLFEIQISFGPR